MDVKLSAGIGDRVNAVERGVGERVDHGEFVDDATFPLGSVRDLRSSEKDQT